MKLKNILLLIFFYISGMFIYTGCNHTKHSVCYCGKRYQQKEKKVFLVDENIETTMMQVMNPKTKKNVFGYFINAMRGDTNFIYSKISFSGDTIMRRDYHAYHITYETDSVISKILCTKKGLVFFERETFFNGVSQKVERPGWLLGQ